MKKLFFLFAFLGALLFSNAIHAQEYKSAIGARLGLPISATYKMFLSESSAVELILGIRSTRTSFFNDSYRFTSIQIGAAYQIHKPINSLEGLYWYYGAGASAYIYNYPNNDSFNDYGSFGIGLSGYLGLDYKIQDVPINLSLDWIPTVFIGEGYYGGFGAGYGGLAVRYTIN